MPNELLDPRELHEVLADALDLRLIGLYQQLGLMGDPSDKIYLREELEICIRAAYWRGASEFAEPC